MANDLTNLHPHIEEMRVRLSETANTERSLVQSLSDALNRLDQDILQSVRNIAADHETRRDAILDELQALAGSIGMFRPQHQPAPLESVATPRPLARPQPTAVAMPEQIDYGHQYGPADWRQATKNMNLQDDLESLLNGLNSKGPKN